MSVHHVHALGQTSSTMIMSLIAGMAPPVLPTCAASVIFRDDNEVAPVGCNVCIPQGTTVTLDCTATIGSSPISYEWRNGDGMVVSNSSTFEVTMEGDYNCTASNEDSPGVSSASVLFCKFFPAYNYIELFGKWLHPIELQGH